MKQNTKYIIIAVVVVIIAYLGYDLLKPSLNPCESIFQQTTTRISGNLETIQTKGDLFIGATQIQKLTERSQMLALNLKTCCILANQEILSSEAFLTCKNNADTYTKKIEVIAKTVKDIEKTDLEPGGDEVNGIVSNPAEQPELNQKVQKINTLIRQSEVAYKAVSREITAPKVLLDSNVVLDQNVVTNFTVCKDAVQGKIAWDYQGHTQWAAENVARLCRGAETSVEPARCFEQVMHGGVSWGGGTHWAWQNAIDLCEGSRNAKATISCFKDKIASGVSWQQAINACDT